MLATNVPEDKILNYDNLLTFLNKLYRTNETDIKVIKYFTTGFSNPTYYIEFSNEKIVLRKKPPGKLLPSAHQIEREYAILSRLTDLSTTVPQSRKVPVPKPVTFCDDKRILGTSFYIMEYVDGRIFTAVTELYSLLPWQRRNVYTSMLQVISAIHSYSAEQLDLPMYKNKDNYLLHNLNVWKRQYFSSVIKDGENATDIRSVEKTREWLQRNMPSPKHQNTLIHGDCRIDSMIFDPVTFKVSAVIDWELSTIGDPLCDLANNCYVYFPLLDNTLKAMRTTFYKDLPDGIPNFQTFLDTYANQIFENNNTKMDLSHFNYYVVFAYYKFAAIVQGVYKRLMLGQASQTDKSRELKDFPSDICKKAVKIADKYDANRLVLPVSISALQPDVQKLYEVAKEFIFNRIIPMEASFDDWYQDPATKWTLHPEYSILIQEAKGLGLWNLFLTEEETITAREVCKASGHNYKDIVITKGLSNIEYAYIAELTGHCVYAPELMNCDAPDTGNMGVFLKYANRVQQIEWLPRMLSGEIKSCFAMTEPEVASSDASNICSSIVIENNELVLNGTKWYISGGNDSRCKICIFMGKSSPSASRHKQQSFVLVPMCTPGVKVIRAMPLFGYDHAPYGHAKIEYKNVRVPLTSMLLGEGRGFEMAQGRLGPGRIHHCMRVIGSTERALSLMINRTKNRVTFGEPLSSRSSIEQIIAESRITIEQNRLLVLKTALSMDIIGNKKAARDIMLIKLAIGKSSQRILDHAIQIFGAAGVSDETPLAHLWSMCRIIRIADGPDEVHARSIAKNEFRNSKL